MDVRWREEAVRGWAGSAANAHREHEIVEFLDGLEASEGVALAPALVEIRAWSALRSGASARALTEFSSLIDEPEFAQRARRGACIAALHAGQEDSETCADVSFAGLRGAQLEAAIASRSLGLLPGWRKDPKREVEVAVRLGPRDDEVAIAALFALGGRDETLYAAQEAALARWRIAVGPGVEAPDLRVPEDSPERR